MLGVFSRFVPSVVSLVAGAPVLSGVISPASATGGSGVMDDPMSAADRASSCGIDVEIASERTPWSTVFATPDGFTRVETSTAAEAYTQQLRYSVAYAQQNGLRFDLHVRGGVNPTTLSGPLAAAVRSDDIALRAIP